MASRFATLKKTWYSPEVLPIFAVIGVAVGGCTWYLARLARGPDVVWNRHGNPEPWNNVQPGTQTKMMTVNQKFENKYKRDKW